MLKSASPLEPHNFGRHTKMSWKVFNGMLKIVTKADKDFWQFSKKITSNLPSTKQTHTIENITSTNKCYQHQTLFILYIHNISILKKDIPVSINEGCKIRLQ